MKKRFQHRYSWECQRCYTSGDSDEIVGSPCGAEIQDDAGNDIECDGTVDVFDNWENKHVDKTKE